MTQLQLNRWQRFLTNPVKQPLHTTPDKKEDFLDVIYVADSTSSSKEAKWAIQVLTEATSSVCYIYDADFTDLEELLEADAREILPEAVNSLLWDLPYNVRCPKDLENAIQDAFGPIGMDNFCDLAKMFLKRGDHGRMIFLQFRIPRDDKDISLWRNRRRLQRWRRRISWDKEENNDWVGVNAVVLYSSSWPLFTDLAEQEADAHKCFKTGCLFLANVAAVLGCHW